MSVRVRNLSGFAVSLPAPYRGIVAPGQIVFLSGTVDTVLSNLGGASAIRGVFDLTPGGGSDPSGSANDMLAVPITGLQLGPTGTSAGNTAELRFLELAANGVNYVGFKAPDSIAANKIWVLPEADGAVGSFMLTDGSGNLSWITAGSNGKLLLGVTGANPTFASMSFEAQITNAGVVSLGTVGALTYYVNNSTGNDSNAGTVGAPFKTIQKAVNSIPVFVKHAVIINVAAQTTTENVTLSGRTVLAGGSIAITGAQTTTIASAAVASLAADAKAAGSARFAGVNDVLTISPDPAWADNAYKGQWVLGLSGTSAGSLHVIVANTHNTIEVKKTSFDNTSVLSIVDAGTVVNGVFTISDNSGPITVSNIVFGEDSGSGNPTPLVATHLDPQNVCVISQCRFLTTHNGGALVLDQVQFVTGHISMTGTRQISVQFRTLIQSSLVEDTAGLINLASNSFLDLANSTLLGCTPGGVFMTLNGGAKVNGPNKLQSCGTLNLRPGSLFDCANPFIHYRSPATGTSGIIVRAATLALRGGFVIDGLGDAGNQGGIALREGSRFFGTDIGGPAMVIQNCVGSGLYAYESTAYLDDVLSGSANGRFGIEARFGSQVIFVSGSTPTVTGTLGNTSINGSAAVAYAALPLVSLNEFSRIGSDAAATATLGGDLATVTSAGVVAAAATAVTAAEYPKANVTFDAKGRATSAFATAILQRFKLSNSGTSPFYISQIIRDTNTGNGIAANTLRAQPFSLEKTSNIRTLAIQLTANGGAGTKIVIGIYDSTSLGYPNNLLAQSTAFAADGGAQMYESTNKNLSLNPGLYWLAALSDDAAAHYVTAGNSTAQLGSIANALQSFINCITVAQAYSATMPSSFPAGATLLENSSSMPVIALSLNS